MINRIVSGSVIIVNFDFFITAVANARYQTCVYYGKVKKAGHIQKRSLP